MTGLSKVVLRPLECLSSLLLLLCHGKKLVIREHFIFPKYKTDFGEENGQSPLLWRLFFPVLLSDFS
jgi:hypothetical protein